ncbi:MAG: MFS transporter [Thaumarchaeota archaeon]|nr:MFS transporter [Nitrososphaerota archaeon]
MSKSAESIFSISKDLLLNRNVRVIAITSLISGVYIGMLNTIIQPFTLSVGLGLTALGILQALGNRFSGITASLIQPFTGHYADVFGRKVVIVAGSAATIGSMILFLIAALTQSWVVLTMAYLLYGISMLSSPASQAVVAESVSLEPTKMHVAFSSVFLFASIPGAVMSFVAGVLADSIGYFVVFVIAVILESVDLFIFVRDLRETKAPGRTPESTVSRDRFSLRSAMSLPKGFLGFFATFAMDSFTFGISATIIYGMLVERFRYSNTEIGLIVGTLAIATILAQYPATRLLVRVGPKKSLALSEFFGCVLMLGPRNLSLCPSSSDACSC